MELLEEIIGGATDSTESISNPAAGGLMSYGSDEMEYYRLVSGRRPPSPRTCDGNFWGSVMPVPIMAPQAGSKCRPAAEAELLYPVVRLLAERE
jgi:hypothetical protein